MGLLFTNFYVGLDIGRYGVEGVKLRKKGKDVEIISSLVIPYVNKAFDGETIVDEGEIALALGKAKSTLKIDVEDYIVTALFPEKILFRKLELPAMPKDQALNAAKFQIVKELSISPEEITVEIEVKQKDLATLDVSSFIVKTEDISKFNGLFFKAGVPFPDILDAGYFKYNYIIKDEFFNGLCAVVFEDVSSTYVELFKDKWLVGIDSIIGGSEETSEVDENSVHSHYETLSDKVQNLLRMMLSRYSMSDSVIEYVILISEMRKNLDVWKEKAKGFEISKNIVTYDEVITINKSLPLAAYSLALRGVNENSKDKFLQKKSSENKTS